MNRKLLEGLLGAAILLALGVLFIPMLLGDPVPRPPPRAESLLPEQPLPDLDLEIPALEAARSGEFLKREPKQDRESRLIGMQPEEPAERPEAVSALTAPTAWSVQVSSFKERASAEKLRDKLRRAVYPAFIRSVERGGVLWYQVRVGPEPHRAEAERLRRRLQQAFALEGLVTRHQ